MKTHLKLASAVAVLLFGLFVSSVNAQQEPPPPPPGYGPRHGQPPQEHFLKMLTEKLSLTDDQQTKVKAVLDDEKAAMDALRDNAQSADRETMHAQAETIMKNHRAQIRALLTTDQQKIFDQLKTRRHGPPPPPPGDEPADQ